MSNVVITMCADISDIVNIDPHFLAILMILFDSLDFLLEACINIVVSGYCDYSMDLQSFYDYFLYDSVYHYIESDLYAFTSEDSSVYSKEFCTYCTEHICEITSAMTSMCIISYESIINLIERSFPEDNTPFIYITELVVLKEEDIGSGVTAPTLIRLTLNMDECYENEVFTVSNIPHLRYNH